MTLLVLSRVRKYAKLGVIFFITEVTEGVTSTPKIFGNKQGATSTPEPFCPYIFRNKYNFR